MSRLYTHINDPEKPLKIVVNHQPTIIYQFPVKLYYILIYLMFNPHIGEMSLSSPVVNTWHKLSIQLSSPHPSWWVAQSTGVFQADPRTGPASFRRRGSDLGHFKGSNDSWPMLSLYIICISHVYVILYYIILYYVILYYIILQYIILYYITLYYIILHYIILC